MRVLTTGLAIVAALACGTAFAADGVQGNWEGRFSSDGGPGNITAKVVALGDNQFGGYFEASMPGGPAIRIPLRGVSHGPLAAFVSAPTEEGAEPPYSITAAAVNGRMQGTAYDGAMQVARLNLERVFIEPPNLGAEPPEGAIVLLDGSNLDEWVRIPEKWNLRGDGAMEVVGSSLMTRREFGDHKLHLEFMTPFMPRSRGQARGNSGVYVFGRYEVQVLDSFADEPADNGCGGIYSIATPLSNPSLPPGQWQTYEITFRAPRFDAQGNKTENAVITVVHNGETIHDALELPDVTPGGVSGVEAPAGPLMLQDHRDRVRFRNIWVQPLD